MHIIKRSDNFVRSFFAYIHDAAELSFVALILIVFYIAHSENRNIDSQDTSQNGCDKIVVAAKKVDQKLR